MKQQRQPAQEQEHSPEKKGKQGTIALSPEAEKNLLLALSKDITQIREKDDLIQFFSKRVKGLHHFTHTIVTLIDEKDETYTPFLLDVEASPIQDHSEYDSLVHSNYSLNEPFIQKVLVSTRPVKFVLEDVMDEPKSPRFLKVNHERGVREILMSVLWNSGKRMGFLHIYTDRLGGFSDEFIEIIQNIVPQVSNAVSNIIKNQELQKKEREKSFLLDFSQDIAAVRDFRELEESIQIALDKIPGLKGHSIRKIDRDGHTMSTYMYSGSEALQQHSELLQEVLADHTPLNDGLQNRVLDSYIPLLFHVDIEIRRGILSKYLTLWKQLGYTRMVGCALRHGDYNLGILWLVLDEINISLLKSLCALIATAMANLRATEELVERNDQQEVLLRFSNEIAGIREKADLEQAIINVLRDLLNTKLAMIHKFDDDGIGLTPYMYDGTLFAEAVSEFQERLAFKKDIYEPYTAKVIQSDDPVAFDVEEELRTTNSIYAQLWKKVGVKRAYGALLKVGHVNIGTLWLLADFLDINIIKGICSQISVAMANILANDQLISYKQQLEQENLYLKEQIGTTGEFTEIIGQSESMNQVYHLISTVAKSNSTVLVLGETGTGKELIARAIHNASPRKGELMIKVNCAAMPANLIESELFGHEKGAFTGAIERRIGKFELANNSTLFLDEIGEMPLEAQVKLLRVLQERELERIGGKNTIKVNVRIIAATNRNLENEVREGRFRSDLYYRLNVFPIPLPPLRERMEDLELLTQFFVDKFTRNTGKKIARIAPRAIQQLHSYTWPGNVRELEHIIERSVLFAHDGVLREVHLQKNPGTGDTSDGNLFNMTLEEMERTFILHALKRCRGKISGPGGAAEALGVPGNTLHSKMKKLSISRFDFSQN